MRRRPIRGMQTTPIPGYPLPTDKLTDYNTALGDELALPDDLTETFTNVVAQIFPLAADMSVLQQFLDGYLNFPSDGENPPVYFKPAAPFVMLEVLNYGSVASNTENVGWFSGARGRVRDSAGMVCARPQGQSYLPDLRADLSLYLRG